MSRLDDALRDALRKQDPGPDFTARVLARAAAEPAPESRWQRLGAWLFAGRLRWAAAALLVLLAAGGGLERYRERRVQAEGEQAKEQLMLALRIAGDKLNLARDKVQQISARN